METGTYIANNGDAADRINLSLLSWPHLPAPFDEALRFAVSDVLSYYTSIAIIAAGSILRGQAGPTSDIDLYVLHHAPFRQRLQRRYLGVPFEIFVNPPHQVRRYFKDEHAAVRPITAHILTMGFVILDRDSIAQTLRDEATSWLAAIAISVELGPGIKLTAPTMSRKC